MPQDKYQNGQGQAASENSQSQAQSASGQGQAASKSNQSQAQSESRPQSSLNNNSASKRPKSLLIKLCALVLALFVAIPILSVFGEVSFIFYEFFTQDESTQAAAAAAEVRENLQHFFKYLFARYITDTLLVSLGTLLLASVIGVLCAYLVSTYEFCFSRYLEHLLMLPLAIPAYILAFVYVGLFDFNGMIHDLTKGAIRINFWNIYGTIFVLAISLYPYIYLFAKTSFKTESVTLGEAARVMGASEIGVFFRVAIFVARPAIFAGVMLVLMETLSDYGAAAYYGIWTFSAGIFHLWYDLSDTASSSVLAAFLMVFVFALMYIEYYFKQRQKYSFNQNTRVFLKKRKMSLGANALACTFCSLVFILGFLLPFIWLFYYGLKDERIFEAEFYILAWHSFLLASGVALLTTAAAFFLSFAARISKSFFYSSFVLKTSSIGYAIPGAAVAISVVVVSVFITKTFGIRLLGASFAVLIFGYIIRFLATAIYSLDSGYTKISDSLDDASLMSWPSYVVLAFKQHLPLLRPFLFLSFVVVFVDTIKELPLTRMLSPANFDTLSTRAFWYATDERIYHAALPSLLIVLLALGAVIWMERSRKKESEC